MRKSNIDQIVDALQSLSYDHLEAVMEFIDQLPKTRIEQISQEYHWMTVNDPKLLPIINHAEGFRQIRSPHWPDRIRNIHYEFMEHGNDIGVEIHLEPREVQWPEKVLEVLGSFQPLLVERYPDAKVILGTYSKQHRALSLRFDQGVSPYAIAQAMVYMIKLTMKPIEEVLNSERLLR
jgi:hypothetical protein